MASVESSSPSGFRGERCFSLISPNSLRRVTLCAGTEEQGTEPARWEVQSEALEGRNQKGERERERKEEGGGGVEDNRNRVCSRKGIKERKGGERQKLAGK